MTSQKTLWLTTAVIGFFLTACGGGGSGDSPTPAPPAPEPPAASAALTITVTGLPATSDSDIDITGPNGFSQTITTDTSLTGLEAGTYSININDVTVDAVTYDVLPAEQTVALADQQTGTLNLIYQSSITSTGVISNFGSVYVNGIRYATDNANITTDNEQNASEDNLGIGMVVTVSGRVTANGDVAEATDIEYKLNAKGPVEAVSLSNSTFTVLGQEFFVDEMTNFDEITFETLTIDMIVEVSALENEAGEFVATHVSVSESSDEFVLRGEIQQLNTDTLQFNLNTTIVDYSDVELASPLENGLTVRTVSSQALQDGIFIADEISIVEAGQGSDEEDNDSGQQIAIDGVISSIVDENTFVVADQSISWNDNTEFQAGDAEDLAVGLRIKAFGPVVDDILVARAIRLDKEGIIKLEGEIQAIDSEASSITVLNTTFTLDNHSHFTDKSDAKVRRLTLGDLSIGDGVDIKAFATDTGLIIRSLVRTHLSGTEEAGIVELTGIVSQIAQPDFQMQNLLITTNEITEFELADDEVTADEFFGQLNSGDVVSVEGIRQSDDTILALEVEIETSDDDEQETGSSQVKLKGIISSFESTEQFIVNGRTIFTNEFTRFEDGQDSDLQTGVLIEIKGREQDNGDILATKIEFERADDIEEVELKGTIDEFTSAEAFSVQGHSVTTTSETIYDKGSASSLTLGITVEVEGVLNEESVLVASKIEFEDDENELRIEGLITQFVSSTDFQVNDIQVTTTEDTEYKNGNSRRLGQGEYVIVEGTLNSTGVLEADEIKFSRVEKVQLEGDILSITSDTSFTLDDYTIIFDEFTEFDDGNISHIVVGTEVEIKGFLTAELTVYAEEIKFRREDDDDDEEGDGDGDEEDDDEEGDGRNNN